jgi:hypothetical protein
MLVFVIHFHLLRIMYTIYLIAIPTHLQNHVVWSRILECSVKPYVTGPSTKCYVNKFLFMPVLTHDKT